MERLLLKLEIFGEVGQADNQVRKRSLRDYYAKASRVDLGCVVKGQVDNTGIAFSGRDCEDPKHSLPARPNVVTFSLDHLN